MGRDGESAPTATSRSTLGDSCDRCLERRWAGSPGQEGVLAYGRSRVNQLMSLGRLLRRVFDIDMQLCPNCGGGELKTIAAILERPVIE